MTDKKIFLNKKILDTLPDFFGTRNFSSYMGEREAYRHLKKWLDFGWILRAKKNFYIKKGADEFYIAQSIYNGYIGFSSALYLHGLKTEIEKKIFVCISSSKKVFNYGQILMVPVNMTGFSFGGYSLVHENHFLHVSTYPKIIFDMFHKPKYADYYSLYRALNWRKPADEEWKTVLKLCRMAPLSTLRRVGFGLEGKAPKWFTKKLENLNSDKGVSFFVPGKRGEYSGKWRVYEPNGIRRWIDEV